MSGGTDLRDELLVAYTTTGRGYHDATHLAEVVSRLDELGAHGATFDELAVHLAAWFHDGVYTGGPDRYAEYIRTVRAEYSHVDDRDFAEGRAQVLRRLAAKPHLFHSGYARAHWEPRARANLDRELRAPADRE